MGELGWLIGELVASYMLERLGEAVRQRGDFSRELADKMCRQVRQLNNPTVLATWLARDEIVALLVEGTESSLARLADLLEAFLVKETPRLAGSAEVREAAEAGVVVALTYFISAVDPRWSINILEYRNQRRHKEVLAAVRELGGDDLAKLLEALPYPVTDGLALASRIDRQLVEDVAWALTSLQPSEALAAAIAIADTAALGKPVARYLWRSLAYFAEAHSLTDVIVRAFTTAAELSPTEAGHLLAHAALAARDDGVANPIIEDIRNADEAVFADAVQAARSGDYDRMLSTIPSGVTNQLLRSLRGKALVMTGQWDEALDLFERMAEEEPRAAHPRLAAASLRLSRGEAAASLDDQKELFRARVLALEARDRFRRWRGESAPAVTIAIQASFALKEFDEGLRLAQPPPEGDAAPEEAAHPDVLKNAVPAALLANRRDQAEQLLQRLPEGFDKAILTGMFYQRSPGAQDLAQREFERALSLATETASLIRAAFALANAGVDPPEDALDQIAATDPQEVSLVRAHVALKRRDYQSVLDHMEGLPRSALVTTLHKEALVGLGRTDEAVGVCRDDAARNANPDLLLHAADVFEAAGRVGEALNEAERALSSAAGGTRHHANARRMCVEIAARSRRWQDVERHARAAIDEGASDDALAWAVVGALWNQRRTEEAYKALVAVPLVPRTEDEAALKITLLRMHGSKATEIDDILTTARDFAASEHLNAAASMAVLTMRSDADLPVGTFARLRAHLEKFHEQFPDSSLVRRFTIGDDIGAFARQIEEMLAPRATALQEVAQLVFLSRIPLNVYGAVAGKTYLETVTLQPLGCFVADSLDDGVIASERSAASEAINQLVVVDPSAIALVLATELDFERTLARYRLIATGAALDDAIHGSELLGLRSTLSVSFDPISQQVVKHEISEEQAAAIAVRADKLRRVLVERCEIVEHQLAGEFAGVNDNLAPAISAVSLAAERGLPLLADDLSLRHLARAHGIRTFGTTAILRTNGDQEVLESLQRCRVVDLPITLERALQLAGDEEWHPGAVGIILTRPAIWVKADAASRILIECARAALTVDPSLLAGWTYVGARGCALASTVVPGTATGQILAFMMAAACQKPAHVPWCIEGARAASTELGGDDPLPGAAKIIGNFLLAHVEEPGMVFSRLFAECEAEERHLAHEAFLS